MRRRYPDDHIRRRSRERERGGCEDNYRRHRSPPRRESVRGSTGAVSKISDLPIDPALRALNDDPRVSNGVKSVRIKVRNMCIILPA